MLNFGYASERLCHFEEMASSFTFSSCKMRRLNHMICEVSSRFKILQIGKSMLKSKEFDEYFQVLIFKERKYGSLKT